MAPPKKKGKISASAARYRKNPKSRAKKAAYDKRFNSSEGQKAKRRTLAKKNYDHDKKNGKASRRGKDAAHQRDGSIKYVDSSKNRGAKTLSSDRRARGKGCKK